MKGDDIVLADWGLGRMTQGGALVKFPLGTPEFLAPEVLMEGPQGKKMGGSKASIMFIATSLCTRLILLHILLQHSPNPLFPSQALDTVLDLHVRRIRSDEYRKLIPETDEKLKAIIYECLNGDKPTKTKHRFQPTLPHILHIWKLQSNSSHLHLKRRGETLSGPSIDRIPTLVRLSDDVDAILILSEPKRLFSSRFHPIDSGDAWKIVNADAEMVEKDGHGASGKEEHRWKVFDGWDPERLNAEPVGVKVGLGVRERDAAYQFARIRLFTGLILEYPLSAVEIEKEARVDIPPFLRGKIWGALLGVKGDPDIEYDAIDKESEHDVDRQLDLDIPRCHQYSELLASTEGHAKLRRILKAWSQTQTKYVYWQGLDSLLAPFLSLNFTHESFCFSSFTRFFHRFAKAFYLPENNVVIVEHMTALRHVINLMDPELGVHLGKVGVTGELFGIPWFMTMFAHIFPLDRIYHLWDTLLTSPDTLFLFVAFSILKQLRETILSRDFNNCMVLFSELPQIDVERCIVDAVHAYKACPPSLLDPLVMLMALENLPEGLIATESTREARKEELVGRISLEDFKRLKMDAAVLDTRDAEAFSTGHIPFSLNVPSDQISSSLVSLKMLAQRSQMVIVIYEDPTRVMTVSNTLFEAGFPRTLSCVVESRTELIQRVEECLCECSPVLFPSGFSKCSNSL
ncbi:hypothetical protein HDU97_009463 [Phlyctochytrium planicorne]|nr:hypothetical protein HDU97_009463 [Phlyctochytrium planicorne]